MRLVEKKVCFILEASNQRADSCPKAICGQALLKGEFQGCLGRGRGYMQKQHSQLWQSSGNWSRCDLISVILIVLSTVNLQFQGWLFSHFCEASSENCGSLMLWQGFGLCVNVFHLLGVSFKLCKSSKDMTRNIIYSPWGGTRSPWLCLVTNLLLFGLDRFPWLLHFLDSLIKLTLSLKFFYWQKAGRGHRGGWFSIWMWFNLHESIEHLLMYLFALQISSWVKYMFDILPI